MKINNSIYKDLHIRTFSNEGEIKGVIVTIHGFAGDKDSSVINAIAEEMVKFNYLVIAFDLPNHGENNSEEIISLCKCFNSLKEIDLLVKKEYGDKKISYFATSFGGYLLLNLLSDNDYKYDKIILRAPAVYMDEILENIIIPEHGYSLEQLKKSCINLGYAKDLIIDYNFYSDLKNNRLINSYSNNCYLNIIQGKKDGVVDFRKNENFFNIKCLGKYKIYYFEEADHRFKNEGELEKIVEITKSIILG